jgi:hypothetical protein
MWKIACWQPPTAASVSAPLPLFSAGNAHVALGTPVALHADMASWRDEQTLSNYDRCRMIDFDEEASAGLAFELEEIERKPLPEPLVPAPAFASSAPVAPSADEMRDAWLFQDLGMKNEPVINPSAAPVDTGLPAMMASVPMGVWKRVAIYPLVGFFIFDVLFPCRGSLRLDLLFALAAIIGATGAFLRLRAEHAWR